MTNLTICIPRLEKTITKKMVNEVFKKYNFGNIDRIDVVNSGPNSKRAFIHFKNWNLNSSIAKDVYTRLKNNQKVNIIHQFPWFWKCWMSRLPKPF